MATAKKASKVHRLVKETAVPDARGQSDTIRVWERYMDMALVWRALALLQIPTTLAAVAFAVVLWQTRVNIINVPLKPAPGTYAIKDVADVEFVDEATEFVNLALTYQPYTAQRQFERAAEHTYGDAFTKFQSDWLKDELSGVTEAKRIQQFTIDPDPKSTVLSRDESTGTVKVSFIGERLRIVGGEERRTTSQFIVYMKTFPRHGLNPYGIMVTDYEFIREKKS